MNEILLQYTDGASNKFWKVEWNDNSITVIYGKVGSAGTSKTTECDNPEVEANKQANAKMKKGYVKIEDGGFEEKKKAYASSEDGYLTIFFGNIDVDCEELEDFTYSNCEWEADAVSDWMDNNPGAEFHEHIFFESPEYLEVCDDHGMSELEKDFDIEEAYSDYEYQLDEATSNYEELFEDYDDYDDIKEQLEELTSSLNGKKFNCVVLVPDYKTENLRKVSKSKMFYYVGCIKFDS